VAILPIDMQAIMLRMDSISKYQQQQQEGVIAAQIMKGEELSQLAQIQSSRVNEVKSHPERNVKIEENPGGGKRGSKGKKGRGQSKQKASSDFEDPYRGTIIDTIR
jgi:hypothetical protein